ncbi:MAG TPA: WecB/TagA/CpsF family glycosyltransferase [Candidatus Polarisedimenticolaceae bacterium]|nr:WecB/TagA/CpsF family glycosyltransferase [Candidatus Polarisedimenticolaceae bacterium]
MPSRAFFLGVPLDLLTMDESVERCAALIREGRPVQHVVINAGKCVLMEDDPGVREIVRHCEIVNADGQSVVWGARFLGIKAPERVAGIDLMGRMIERCEREGWPVYLLGAKDEVLAAFVAEARRRHPRLVVAGARNGYFSADQEVGIAETIRNSGARLLLVGISSPKKERFLAEHLPRMGAVLAMGVGGSFDVWAGKTRRAPMWMQKAGLEWFYRFAQEPGRMWRRYLIGNLRFGALVLRARFGARSAE